MAVPVLPGFRTREAPELLEKYKPRRFDELNDRDRFAVIFGSFEHSQGIVDLQSFLLLEFAPVDADTKYIDRYIESLESAELTISRRAKDKKRHHIGISNLEWDRNESSPSNLEVQKEFQNTVELLKDRLITNFGRWQAWRRDRPQLLWSDILFEPKDGLVLVEHEYICQRQNGRNKDPEEVINQNSTATSSYRSYIVRHGLMGLPSRIPEFDYLYRQFARTIIEVPIDINSVEKLIEVIATHFYHYPKDLEMLDESAREFLRKSVGMRV